MDELITTESMENNNAYKHKYVNEIMKLKKSNEIYADKI
jgi:hypothetical protein